MSSSSSSLPSLLIQPNSCSTQNPIQALSKTIHPNSNYSHTFQPSASSSSAEQPLTDQLINLHLQQEQQQHNHTIHPQHDWSTNFLKFAPALSLLPAHRSTRPNQWQSEFVGSLQPAQDHHHPQPINDTINHFHPSIQRRPIFPSTIHPVGFPTQLNRSVQSTFQATRSSTDWESAFSKYGTNDHNNTLVEQNAPSVHHHEQNDQVAHGEYLPGSHSPTRSTSPDALARTAASLIATVEKSGQLNRDLELINQQFQPSETSVLDPAESATEKLIQSGFIDFIRKLRDGELKVEGDQIVQQSVPTTTDDHPAPKLHNLHQQQSSGGLQAANYGQGNQSFGTSPSLINQPVAQSNARSPIDQTHESIVSNPLDHQATITAYRRDLESRMKEMNQVMEETDEELERAQYRDRMNAFQGDGGAISSSPVDLDDILNAASQVGQPLENQSWTTTTGVPGASELWTEEFDPVSSQDEGLEEFFDAMGMFGRPILDHEIELERLKRAQRVPSSQQLEWERFQSDWESMANADDHAQASSNDPIELVNTSRLKFLERIKALKAETGYDFQHVNPHFLGEDSRTRHHYTHQGWEESTILEETLYSQDGSPLESVLQKEKEVLDSPESATAWYELGVKQQENEREELAIQALKKAIQLDPQLSDAVLALAISYANENQRDLAFEMIEDWINVQVSQVPNYREHFPHTDQNRFGESNLPAEEENNVKKLRIKHERLTQKLIQIARLGGRVKGSASVDPDVQIALGVLFNSNDDFQKACDCFAAALAVRPSDPLLFNRLGATLANSGKPEEAIEYYQRAIELLPCYIRARYNLSISLINLGKYFDSLKNLINALIIQQQDQDEDDLDTKQGGRTRQGFDKSQADTSSDVLWQTLEINCSLLKNELSTVQTELDQCFAQKDLARISKILVNFS